MIDQEKGTCEFPLSLHGTRERVSGITSVWRFDLMLDGMDVDFCFATITLGESIPAHAARALKTMLGRRS